MLHHESDCISPLSTAEVLKNALAWNYKKGRCFFVVERTQRLVILTRSLERNKIADYIDNVEASFDFIYGFATDQGPKGENR